MTKSRGVRPYTRGRICTASDCDRPVRCKNLCTMHYSRMRDHGDLIQRDLGPQPKPAMDRFHAAYRITDAGCWEWQLHLNGNGYARFFLSKNDWTGGPKVPLAHRFAYERLVGPIPEGLQLDHLCRNRACVNPDHLEPVTPLVNTRRAADSPATINAAKTTCVRGHLLIGANLALKGKRRICVTCRRDECRRRRVRVASEVAVSE